MLDPELVRPDRITNRLPRTPFVRGTFVREREGPNRKGKELTDWGGKMQILEYGSKKSTRVAKSSWGAELLAAVRAFEKGSKLCAWFHELYYGVRTA